MLWFGGGFPPLIFGNIHMGTSHPLFKHEGFGVPIGRAFQVGVALRRRSF